MQLRLAIRILACLLVSATAASLGGTSWAHASTARTGAADNTAAAALYIETCSLGCSSGSGGNQISCGVLDIYLNEQIDIQFSRPVDPASVTLSTFEIIDINTGQIPVGTRFVDPLHPTHVVFRPQAALGPNGQWVFGFQPNTIYRIIIPGVAQADSGPFITSADVPALENQSRMQCDIQTTLGFQSNGVRYCSADGTATHCPCANSTSPAGGCPNSSSASGASLVGVGVSSLSNDSLSLFASGMPDSLAIFLQGTSSASAGQGLPLGDGLACVDGRIIRLASQSVGASLSYYPGIADLPVSVRGRVSVPGTRTYQVWYRDPTSFCTADRFNLTNGLSVTWGP